MTISHFPYEYLSEFFIKCLFILFPHFLLGSLVFTDLLDSKNDSGLAE